MNRRARTVISYTEPAAAEEDDSFTLNEEEQGEEEEGDEWEPEKKVPKRQKKAQPAVKTTARKATKPKVERKPRKPRAKQQTPAMDDGDGHAETKAAHIKEERLSLHIPAGDPEPLPSSSHMVKKEEPEEDFAFEEPPLKKMKTPGGPQGKAVPARGPGIELKMNWDPIQLISERIQLQPWVCANVVHLLHEENTIPFIVRYRKELINHMDADGVREVQLALEELSAVSKKSQSIASTLRKEGVLTAEIDEALKNCRSTDELDHVYAPYKKGSTLSKASRAKQLGLEPAAHELLRSPHSLNLRALVKPQTKGLSTLEDVSAGVQHILADIISKDKETLAFVRSVCDRSDVRIQSSITKTSQKEQQQQQQKPGEKWTKQKQGDKSKDIDKFHLYWDFTCNVKHVQHHQVLAINRGENLKILTVKVNIPDWVKQEFCRWCVMVRWRPNGHVHDDIMKILHDAVEDSYKRLILPLLCRSYRSSLTANAEKESIAMFVRNLRQRLLVCPVRDRVIMGVDPGFHHGCKLAILSPTSQILHTDVVYLHSRGGMREADKLRALMMKYTCQTVVIGNGTACRETEAYFTDLIAKKYFHPLDVSYCITNEAGASIYSVSPEAVKEMPDLDPNLRSAVSIGRRVQDPLAELVKIDPKHIGIGTYQHDVSQTALKAALDAVVEECVSFVGVDINMCSEVLMRHVAGLNASRARSIMEWREKNGRFVNREQLKLVRGLGPKSFQQCAGFIRINPENLQNAGRKDTEGIPPSVPAAKPVGKKGKGKAAVPTTYLPNPLDLTCIHPESYSVAQRFLALVSGRLEEVGRPEIKPRVEASLRQEGLEQLAKTLETSRETLQLIVDGLTQPPGFDIRQSFEQADFKRGVVSMSDLRVGAILTGRVENTALFGAFVDIGVGCSGLIHKRYITAGKLPQDQRHRSLALGPGERVEVQVLSVDMQRGRIALDLIRVLR